MGLLREILTVVLGIALIFALGKGFPQFGRVLGLVFLNPIGIVCLGLLILWIILMRQKARDRRAAER